MKARITLALILIIATQCVCLLACGDKYIVPTRGSRSQRPGAPREQAKILVFDSGHELQRGIKGGVLDILTRAGFRPTLSATMADFKKQLAGSRFDAVLASIGDAPSVTELLRGNANGPVVIPVGFEITDAEAKETRKQYPVMLRVPAKNDSVLSAIDKALAQRRKSKRSNSL